MPHIIKTSFKIVKPPQISNNVIFFPLEVIINYGLPGKSLPDVTIQI